jgi:phage head maturation protease
MTDNDKPLGDKPVDGSKRTRDIISRDYPLENIEIISRAKGGDGRTVEAYAAIFDSPTEINDQYGNYRERIHRAAFNMSVNSGAARKAECLYNHGYNPITRRPDVVASIALGTPVDIRVEPRGLLTVTRYNTTPLAEATLCAIKDGQIQSQSFEGPCFKSDPMRVPRVRRGQELPLVTRLELGLRNYGPTPSPAYDEPMVTVVRSIISEIKGLTEDEYDELIRALTSTRDGEPLDSATTTPDGAGAVEPRNAHSGRLTVRANRMAMDLALMELGVKGQ